MAVCLPHRVRGNGGSVCQKISLCLPLPLFRFSLLSSCRVFDTVALTFFFFGVKSKRSYKSSEPNLTTVSFLFPFFKIMRGSCIVEDVEREVSQIRVENLPSDLFPVSRNMTGPIRVLKKMATATNRLGCEENKKLPIGNIILLPTGSHGGV